MNKNLVLMLSLMTLPIFGEKHETLEEYLEEQKAEDRSYIRRRVCSIDMLVYKKDANDPMGYLLSCPDAKEFMKTLLQISDKSPYSLSLLMEKHDEENWVDKEVHLDISIEEAHTALEAFTASMNDRLTQIMEKQRQYHIHEYEKKFGSFEKK